MAVSPDDQLRTMLNNLPEKTGRSLDEWMSVLAGRESEKFGKLVAWLKSEHGVTHGFANLIVHSFQKGGAKPSAAGDVSLVDAQFPPHKAHLRPIYESVMEQVRVLGKDAEIAPKKSYVSLRRKKQFGLVQVSTKTRVDLGLNLPGVPADGRLEDAGSFNGMVSHRVRLTEPGDVDAEVVAWIQAAYDRAG